MLNFICKNGQTLTIFYINHNWWRVKKFRTVLFVRENVGNFGRPLIWSLFVFPGGSFVPPELYRDGSRQLTAPNHRYNTVSMIQRHASSNMATAPLLLTSVPSSALMSSLTTRWRPPVDGAYTCPVCGKSLKTKPCLSSHMIRHSGRKFECHVCHKTFPHPIDVRQHHRVVHEEKRYQCSICVSRFSTKQMMMSHMITQHGQSHDHTAWMVTWSHSMDGHMTTQYGWAHDHTAWRITWPHSMKGHMTTQHGGSHDHTAWTI